jgi:putative two-component system response regulator
MKKILVIDDNLLTLKQLEAHLSRKYEVMLAKSGKIAVEICKVNPPDLILLDVAMPEMNGFDVLAKLKKNPRLEYTPIVVLTGNFDSETEIRALENGAMDFIAKPVNRTILFHRLDLHLRLFAYQTRPEEIVRNLENSMAASFSELIEYKTDYYGNHGDDTARYTRLLGKEMIHQNTFGGEVNDEELEKIVRGSSFHDVGKIGISDEIIQKPGKLTAEEFEIIKKHTVIGSDVLERIYGKLPHNYFFRYAQLIAIGHHERWDGTGYPDNIAGDEIPLCCRIAAVANVYASCRSKRNYRDALSHEEASKIIIEEKGKYFDARIVEVFESLEKKFNQISKEIEREQGEKKRKTPSLRDNGV